MSVDAGQLQRIAMLIARSADLHTAVAAVRAAFPQLRTQIVDALDVKTEQPAFRVGTRHVFLVASDGHCWQITRDPARAAGLLLAQS